MRLATEFSGDHKKEKPNNEERVLSEIKVAGMEKPAEENVTKTSDNLKMAELNPDTSEKNEFIQTQFE